MNSARSLLSLLVGIALAFPSLTAQEVANAGANAPKYKLTILEGASTSKRVKKGRVSSQAVVKITDQNNVPVSGIAVSFALPQLISAGPAFAHGVLTAIVTTNAAGIASSGSIAAAAGSTFSVTVSASVAGGSVLTAAVPVTTATVAAVGAAGAAGAAAGAAGAAGAGAAAGIFTGVIVGVAAAVGAAAVAGVAVSMKGGGGSTPTTPTGTIGGPGTPTFGAPH